jgi:hypothetical protein
MINREIGRKMIVSILRKHSISKKIAEQIVEDIYAAFDAEWDRKMQEKVYVIPLPIGEENGRLIYHRDKCETKGEI